MFLFRRVIQGFEIHGSTGAALPDKKYGWQKKLEEYLKKKSSDKEKSWLKMLILFLNNMA